jgi:hypothetical protein
MYLEKQFRIFLIKIKISRDLIRDTNIVVLITTNIFTPNN